MPLEKYVQSGGGQRDHADRRPDSCQNPNHHQVAKSRNQPAQLREEDGVWAEALQEEEAFQEVGSVHQEGEAQAQAASVEVAEEERREGGAVQEVEDSEEEDEKSQIHNLLTFQSLHLELKDGVVRAQRGGIEESFLPLRRIVKSVVHSLLCAAAYGDCCEVVQDPTRTQYQR